MNCEDCKYCGMMASEIHEEAKKKGIKVRETNAVVIDVPSDVAVKQPVAKIAKKPMVFCKGGRMEFDNHCEFGNDVELTPDQVAYLSAQVKVHKPSIPYYVCKMTNSNVIPGKAKMYFSACYSNAHLNQYLPKELPLRVAGHVGLEHVQFTQCKSGVAQMTSNWSNVLNRAGIKKGDVCVFTFFNEGLDGFMGHVACLN